MANLENQIKAAMERVFPARQQSAAGDSQQREALPATQADRVFRAYQLRTPQRRQREDLPSLDQAKKAYQKALQEHRASQRAAQAKEKARVDQTEARAQVEALEKDLARLLEEGGEDSQGIELESRIGFYRRKASHAQQVQEEKPALLPQELAQLRAALEKEREAAARLTLMPSRTWRTPWATSWSCCCRPGPRKGTCPPTACRWACPSCGTLSRKSSKTPGPASRPF